MPKLIRRDRVVDDDWVLLTGTPADDEAAPERRVLVPLAAWLAARETLRTRGDVGVWLAPDDDPAPLADDIAHLPVIAVAFPAFGDGRGFSIARLLRERYGFRGELRAIGDIFQDQLFFLAECGFDAFAVRNGLDPERERAGLEVFERVYAHGVRATQPWFRARAAATAEDRDA